MENHFEDRVSDSQPAPLSPAQAQSELEGMSRDGEKLAARVVTPWWYHSALGVITAIFAGAHALPGAWPMAAIIVGITAIPVLTTSYARKFGVVVTRPAGPRSKRLMLVTLAVLVAAMACSLAIKFLGLDPWLALIPAGITFTATVVLGRRYDDALRQEIAEPVAARA